MFLKKTLPVFCLCLMCSAVLTAGGAKDTAAAAGTEKPAIVRVSALNGSSGVSMAPMFDNTPVLDGVPVLFEVSASADVLLPKLLKGEIDIGILPPNVAAKVYTKNNGALVMGAVVGNGMLYLITKDKSIDSLFGLKGKKVAVAGFGATPEYMFRYLLDKAGISANGTENGGVELDFSIPASEIGAALIADKVRYALVPEPFASAAELKDPSVRRAFNLQEFWAAVPYNPAAYPMTVVVIRKEFAEKYPQIVRLFLNAYKNAVNQVNSDPVGTAELVGKYTLGLSAPVTARSIPVSNFVYTSAADARKEVEQLLNIFLTFAPDSIGGKLPDDGFYFK